MPQNSVPLHLHIGLAKTATTTLQKTLFRKHPQVRYFGQYVPSSISMLCESEEVHQILRPLLWDTHEPLNADSLRESLFGKVLQASPGKTCLVASWEGLASLGVEKILAMIERVRSVFGGCKILLTLRNPLHRLPSEYLESLKGHFIKGSYKWIGPDPYISLDQWFERAEMHGHFQNMVSYGQSIQKAVNLLGHENVGVFLFEELNESPKQFFTRVCEFLQIDVAEGLAVTDNEHLHVRRTQGEFEFLRRLNHSHLQRRLLSFLGRNVRKAILERKSDGRKAESPEVSPSWVERINAETGRWHRWLADTFNLPLGKYGYPIIDGFDRAIDSLENTVPS